MSFLRMYSSGLNTATSGTCGTGMRPDAVRCILDGLGRVLSPKDSSSLIFHVESCSSELCFECERGKAAAAEVLDLFLDTGVEPCERFPSLLRLWEICWS